MLKLKFLLYTDGFRYRASWFLINESIPSCFAYCIQYGVSYKVCCVTVLSVCICMLYCVMPKLYRMFYCLLKSLLFWYLIMQHRF